MIRTRRPSPTFEAVLARRLSRRGFLGAAAALLAGAAGRRPARAQAPGFAPVALSSEDRLILPAGYAHDVVLRWGDPLFPGVPAFDPLAQSAARQAQQFGYDNDFLAFMPLPMGSGSPARGLLGVNHENARAELMWAGWDGKPESRTREMVDVEMAAHGFSVVEVMRSARGSWSYAVSSPYNRRITGMTPIGLQGPAAGHALLRTAADPAGAEVLGMFSNCAGGVTPWGTILTGEENVQNYFAGTLDAVTDPALRALHQRYGMGTGRGRQVVWGRHHARLDLRREPNEPNRFGWVVEIDPYEPLSRPVKHTALGRFAHEGATVVLARDGRPVVYMGDDARNEYVYKFVAAGRYDPAHRVGARALLDAGTLYAARFDDDGSGRWLPLVHGEGPLTLASGFRSQAEVVINARRAGDLVGATRMDRPEDVEASPVTGKVYVALTYNETRKPDEVNRANPRANNRFGHILELSEDGGDTAATRFRWEVFILAGDPRDPAHGAWYQGRADVSPFACPDNFAFDTAGRLWVATDGIDDTLGQNDGLFVVDTEGPLRGRSRQLVSGLPGGEVTGPVLTPDDRTLFLAIQHPGLVAKATYERPGSRWPDKRPDMPPRPSVVAIYREDGGKVGE
jgi:hypothetical protein